MSRYPTLLRQPGIRTTLAGWLLAGIPNGVIFLALLLLFTNVQSYTAGGVAAGLYGAGIALTSPVHGWAIARYRARNVLAITAVAYPATLAAVLWLHTTNLTVAFTLVALAGATAPPAAVCVRATWPELLTDPQLRHTAYTVQALTDELFYIAGPLIAGALTATINAHAAIGLSATCAAFGALTLARTIPTLPHLPTVRMRPLPRPLIPLALCAALVAVSLGFVELAAVASADVGLQSGVLLAIWSAGSLLAGLVYGQAARNTDAHHHLTALLLLLTVTTLIAAVTATSSSALVIAVGLFVAGLGLAPTLAAICTTVPRRIGHATPAEAFGWFASITAVGTSVGLAAAGWAVEMASPAMVHVAAAGLALAAAAIWQGAPAKPSHDDRPSLIAPAVDGSATGGPLATHHLSHARDERVDGRPTT